MVILEDIELEKTVTTGVSCIAVPVEIYKTKNEIIITCYSFCKSIAVEFEKLYSDEPFTNKALEWLNSKLSPIMTEMGYAHYSHEGELMLEYVLGDIKPFIAAEVTEISSQEVLDSLCENTGCDIELNGCDDVIYAVVENGIIKAYAGINDVLYDDNSVEISVETDEECRRKGYGASCVCALCKELISRGLKVRYKCSIWNKPSYALAEKVGFSLEGKRFSYICGHDEDN